MAEEKKTKTDVAVKKESVPSGMEGYDMDDLLADASLGSEELGANDIAIPYLAILQGLSPQVNEGGGEYIEGARPSMLLNTVTGDIYEGRKNGILVVPAYYTKKWNVWLSRESGGGLMDVYDDDSILKDCEKNEKNQYVLKDNNNLVVFETAYHYLIRLNEETMEMERMVMGLKSTGLKANRKLNHLITSAKIPGHPDKTAPRFMFAYRLTTFLEEKNGNSWWSPEFKRLPDPVAVPVYKEAKAYYEMLKEGGVKIVGEDTDNQSEGGGRAQVQESSSSDDEEIPF